MYLVSLFCSKYSDGFPPHIKYYVFLKYIPRILPLRCASNMLMYPYFRAFALYTACAWNSLLPENSTTCPSLHSGPYPNVIIPKKSSLMTVSIVSRTRSVSSPLPCCFSFVIVFLNTQHFVFICLLLVSPFCNTNSIRAGTWPKLLLTTKGD